MTAVRTIESFVLSSINEHEIPKHMEGLPLSSDELNHLLENCPGVMTLPASDTYKEHLSYLPDSDQGEVVPELKQPSPDHQRSFQIIGEQYERAWTDEYGNTYNALSLKGNNFSQPGIIETRTASNGYIAYGLQESEVIGRVLKASQSLRERGISTEYILGIAEPKQLPWPTIDSNTDIASLLSVSEYKGRMLQEYWRDLRDDVRTKTSFAELFQKFQDMTFYVSLRASDSAYRMHDLKDANARSAIYAQANASLPESEHYDSNKREDCVRYIGTYITSNVARNFAKLHTDLAHRFPHSGNITALGGLVDLDSVHGEGLGIGDEPITMHDRAQDVAYFAKELIDAYDVHRLLSYMNLNTTQIGMISDFIKEYLEQVAEVTSPEAMPGYAAEFLVEFKKIISSHEYSHSEFVWTQIIPGLTAYIHRIACGETNEDGEKEFVVKLTHMIAANTELRQAATAAIKSESHNYCEYINILSIDKKSDDYRNGQDINYLPESVDDGQLLEMITTDIIVYFSAVFADNFAKNGGGYGLFDAIESIDAKKAAYEYMISQKHSLLYEQCYQLANEIFTELRAEMVESLLYETPQVLFGDHTDHLLQTGFCKGRYWTMRDGAEWDEIATVLQERQIPVTSGGVADTFAIEHMNYSSKLDITASSPDRYIVEIVTDVFISLYSFEDITLTDTPVGTFEFDEGLPQFIVVVEKDSDGATFVRVLTNPETPATDDQTTDYPQIADNSAPAAEARAIDEQLVLFELTTDTPDSSHF